MLSPTDADILQSKPHLVHFLVEPSTEGKRCFRLIYYRSVASNVLKMFKENDAAAISTGRPPPGFAENMTLRELETARQIQCSGFGILGLLEEEHMRKSIPTGDCEPEPEPVCRLYARLVLGHEEDKDCEPILKELREWKDGLSSKQPFQEIIRKVGYCG